MRIIPAIDIIDGKCVRLTKGDYSTKKVYNENPLEVAKQFEAAGLRHLHLVDLDGAKSEGIVNYRILEQIASETSLQVDFGGGLKTDEDLRIAFESGAKQITGGSIAVKKRELFLLWLRKYGPEKIILGADCLQRNIATNGWLNNSTLDVIEFIQDYETKGIRNAICTDIAKDGMLAGPSIKLYQEILAETNIRLIASGGVSSIEDLIELKEIGCEGAILGKAIYEGNITLKQLEKLC
ncbi:1-(5-phosphoribosyl)-5-[(5-phosphoribosylamino)methylideneamino] imidazole-4-carboxamide isomerase [Ulvibacter sp. MAR_2010_11]|uniref:1-(5-phosphoribosyl)-5-[(5- phosphoribosylamino)methylideneamino]imidazole-4- carboxamide isomerase n=1 Tax=Ulvibacter sp. MAR_2010_11 TaxID=1250229 RepID=UPI000C2B9126|nr:1-(5-phosphoribosyl)-5-[(5-phosphoribosylamino)methylideneamino]imidazole-4-carboxamide isomerase [Ulvibacter sp. MAR_2010_11]PKA84020.1 1-(5-phosphoribosyl)-5-[(5-phosphoribosylamino)methylideneamino] imidazole-4-carboxamide isomerase [Ulvibacter sp. MAR_2010_11]